MDISNNIFVRVFFSK